MQEYIDAQEILGDSGYWDLQEPDQYEKRQTLRLANPEIEEILVKWYNYKPAQGTYVPRYYPPQADKEPVKFRGFGVPETDRFGREKEPVFKGFRK